MRNDQQCYAVRGKTMIDTINPATGLTHYYSRTLENVQAEYPGAELMTVAEFCADKAARQDAEPLDLIEITDDKYSYYLEVVPPATMNGRGFLVGEPMDHHAGSGQPRYTCCVCKDGKRYQLASPITLARFTSLYGGKVAA